MEFEGNRIQVETRITLGSGRRTEEKEVPKEGKGVEKQNLRKVRISGDMERSTLSKYYREIIKECQDQVPPPRNKNGIIMRSF